MLRKFRSWYKAPVLDRLTVDDFRPLAGEMFHVSEHGIDLRLERVTEVMESGRGDESHLARVESQTDPLNASAFADLPPTVF